MARSRTEWMTENRRASSSSVRNLISLRFRFFGLGLGGGSSSGKISEIGIGSEGSESRLPAFQIACHVEVSAGLHENDTQKRNFVELSMAVRAAGAPQFGSGSA